MKMKDYQHVYFLGIGGIGMSAIARYFMMQGCKVSGYDRTRTKLTEQLEAEGIHIDFDEAADLIPQGLDLVVYTPAIPKDHKGYLYLLTIGIQMLKRSEVLGIISNAMTSVGIAGTHGKTTTSSMVAHVLKVGGKEISAFLGGIVSDYGTNYLVGKSDIVVLEADEYDRSFLTLHPYIASISSMDADHLDIYGDEKEMHQGFIKYAQQIKVAGYLIIKAGLLDFFDKSDLENLADKGVTILEFGEDQGQVQFSNLRVVGGNFCFDYHGLKTEMKDIVLSMPGLHNVENATVAITVGLIFGVNVENIKKAMSGFKGIQRRFERVISTNGITYIDDYAHHPSELHAAISAARRLYPDRKISGIFQPHLYSRTRDFVDGFAKALDEFDEVFLMEIYPARELPIPSVTSGIVFDLMKSNHKTLVTKDNLMEVLESSVIDVLMTLGAGDIDTFVPKIKKWIEEK